MKLDNAKMTLIRQGCKDQLFVIDEIWKLSSSNHMNVKMAILEYQKTHKSPGQKHALGVLKKLYQDQTPAKISLVCGQHMAPIQEASKETSDLVLTNEDEEKKKASPSRQTSSSQKSQKRSKSKRRS